MRFPDPRLRNKAKEVSEISPHLADLAQAMLSIMYEQNGVGLSSIQVNRPERIFTADTSNHSQKRYKVESMGELERNIKQPLICFNPKITHREGSVLFNEGCLSFPSYYAEVKRSALIEMEAYDIQFKPFTIKTDGLLAICIQHEIDHLDGKLFIDHLSPLRAQQLRDQIKKYGYPPMEQKKTS